MRRVLSVLLAALLLISLCGCGGKAPATSSSANASSAESSASSSETAPAPATPTSFSGDEDAKPFDKSSVTWVNWDGAVEHLFFHPVIAYPEAAFRGDYKAEDLDEWMITAEEYQKILQSLYDNGYILVDINQVWHEETDATGKAVMVRSELQVPEGKKPIILSYDDVNYYEYMLQYGFTWKLLVGDNGQLWSYGKDPQGNDVYSQDLDAVTYLDKFCRTHPDFTPYGVKGCLSLTGYEGILGYRTQTEKEDQSAEHEASRQKEIEAVKPVIAALKTEGWTFGSHTWGHINLAKKSLETVKTDTQKWANEVGSLVGPTTILFYPHGARPDGDDVKQSGPILQYLQAQGFRVFCSVGIESYSKIKSDPDLVICDRLHADGTTLRHSRQRYLKFYDAKAIMDTVHRPDLGVDWD
jgi:predicted small lipoprotein YifL